MILPMIASIFLIVAIVCFFNLTPRQISKDINSVISKKPNLRDRARVLRAGKNKKRLGAKLGYLQSALVACGKESKFALVCSSTLLLFAIGAIVAVLVNNVFLIPTLSIEETKLHSAICRGLNKLFSNKDETISLLRSNLKYAITGSDDSCDAYSLENQILKLEEESEHLMELMSSTSGDTDRFLNEIKNNFEQVKLLREKLQIAKISAESDLTINSELERLEKMFVDTEVSFNEYDDVIVRRLIECIRVMKGKKIIVVLKGGFQVEENLI